MLFGILVLVIHASLDGLHVAFDSVFHFVPVLADFGAVACCVVEAGNDGSYLRGMLVFCGEVKIEHPLFFVLFDAWVGSVDDEYANRPMRGGYSGECQVGRHAVWCVH